MSALAMALAASAAVVAPAAADAGAAVPATVVLAAVGSVVLPMVLATTTPPPPTARASTAAPVARWRRPAVRRERRGGRAPGDAGGSLRGCPPGRGCDGEGNAVMAAGLLPAPGGVSSRWQSLGKLTASV